jgi:adenylate cyclase
MSTASRKRRIRLLTRLLISAACFLFLALHVADRPRFEIIDRIENYLYDVRIRMTMPGTVDDRIVIIDIDEASQLQLGQWPWSRATLASIVDRLFDDYEIKVLGMDVLFAERERNAPEGNERFAESLIARDVVTGMVFKDFVADDEPEGTGELPPAIIAAPDLEGLNVPFVSADGYVGSLNELQDNASGGGFFDSPLIDADGVFRRAPLVQQYRGDLYPSLGLAVARLALGSPDVGLRFAGDGRSGVDLESFQLGELNIPVSEELAVFIPYRGPQESFRFIPAKDVLAGSVDKALLDGKIALLGASAAGLLDLRSTPVGQRYIGVEAHANLVAGLIDGEIRYAPSYSDGLELILLLLIALLTALLLPRLAAITGFLLLAGMVATLLLLNLWLWSSFMLVVPIASLLVCTFLSGFLHLTYGFFVESRNKRHLSHIFGQYIPPKLVEEIDSSGAEVSLQGETREMSVLFSDVRSFTTISEGLDARELTQMMNEFLTPFTRAIQDHRGTIDKYMGDCVMAFWGAPLADEQHAEHALESAYDMLRAVRDLDAVFTAKGWPKIRVGVGVASGDMNVGNMGSEFRVAYTVMGDTVNLGSRLEGLTKQYGVDIIVNSRTTELAPMFAYRELDLVRVKGKHEPVAIFEPMGRHDQIETETAAQLQEYSRALAAYRAQHWLESIQMFENLNLQHPHLLYNVYLDRIRRFQEEPPQSNWDGVFDHLTK